MNVGSRGADVGGVCEGRRAGGEMYVGGPVFRDADAAGARQGRGGTGRWEGRILMPMHTRLGVHALL